MAKTKIAIIGSGNIGTDLMFKVIRLSDVLEMGVMVGIDPASDGLARAARLGFETTSNGVDGLIASPQFNEIGVVFDATSAGAHRANAEKLLPYGKRLIDLTPAAIGPYVVPAVNMEEHLDAPDINMVTCGGQATIPIVAAINAVAPVHYGEIVASIASLSAGPGTRANIDEFTETTSQAIEKVGGAARGKAIIVLNPAEPAMIMRDTVQVLTSRLDDDAQDRVRDAVAAQAAAVAEYVPGYRLKQDVQFLEQGSEADILVPTDRVQPHGYTRVSVFLEVEGAAMYLPSYAGNLDIMTSAALRTAERVALSAREKEAVA
ncbi:acetaldehyde dehydrogenase (acetylating) [Microbacterium azadirachtae]|uniref:Acetaldehyde dehydrogenase n=1 Tax=Microbacterium azadirachtae TaxID=582680 RepID=A0A1I6G7Z2_9MICO|nr:acetaldehyde dehydrogenase (acetylating) [Microbacterium azadirachtae]SDL37094.1 acetaldehyde dehydrogenase [Microbacterium azadirachtae]SEF67913.1 acetaldehyde dehydrogenase [Microbacterium azadirachtae]SEF68633.1 acetaldehyde dehydrogenase [Microbacterium azadirachtae]SFR38309.1 acetaldehyde dehydrogenase [Microbacterium azadirachtae]